MELSAEEQTRFDGVLIRLEGPIRRANVSRGGQTVTRGGPDDRSMSDLLMGAGFRLGASLELELSPSPPTVGRGEATDSTRPARVVLEPPPLAADETSYVMLVEEEGELRWVFRDPRDQTFTVEVDASEAAERGVVGAAIRKGVKFLAIKAIKPLAQAGVRSLVSAAESRLRPHRVRTFTASNFRSEQAEPPDAMSLVDGPALLFVHGTNSQTHDGFGRLERDWVAAINHRYEGRVFALDHPTLSVSPSTNADFLAEWVHEQLPDGVLHLDILAHSRGGLVARELAERPRAGLGVRSITFVATPNNGTPLCDADHLGDLVDVLTNLAAVVPDNPITTALEVIFELVKDIALRIAYDALPGIKAMEPGGDYLADLNSLGRGETTVYRAIAADFEPWSNASPIRKLRDRVFDRVFDGAMNDLVVPTRSGYLRSGAFGVDTDKRVVFDSSHAIDHSSYWTDPTALDLLSNWLRPDWPTHPPTDAAPESADPKADIESAIAAPDPAGLLDPLLALTSLPSKIADAIGMATGGPVSVPAGRSDKLPAVVVLPGIMGSLLNLGSRRIWISPMELRRGGLAKLNVGRGQAGVSAVGLHPVYAPLAATLSRNHQVFLFPFDWRLDIEQSATELNDFIVSHVLAGKDKRPVHLVAHSMGGLVARWLIHQYPRTWAKTTVESTHRDGGRLLMLGTPNRGSYAIPLAFCGADALVKGVAAIDTTHDRTAIAEILASFPGIYQMLPAPTLDVDDDHALLYQATRWSNRQIDQSLLTKAEQFHAALEGDPADNARLAYVAGDGVLTPARVRIENGEQRFGRHDHGDGRVLHESSLLPGLNPYYCQVGHGALASSELVLVEIESLLATGSAPGLASSPAPRRSLDRSTQDSSTPLAANEVDPEPRQRITLRGGPTQRVSTSDLSTTMSDATSLYLGTSATAPATALSLGVRVTHASLEQAEHPVLVGHYSGIPVDGAEGFINIRLDDALSRHRDLGDYPGLVGDVLFVEAPNARPRGAIVIGLGEFGELTRSKLVRSVRRAAITRALRAAERDDQERIGVSAVLTSTPGSYGLTVESTVAGLVEGVARAVLDLAMLDHGRVWLEELEIIELYEERASQAVAAANRVAELLPVDLVNRIELRVPEQLDSGRGRRPGMSTAESAGMAWPRIVVERRLPPCSPPPTGTAPTAGSTNPEGGSPDDHPPIPCEGGPTTPAFVLPRLEFTSLGRGAQVDRLAVEIDTDKLDRLIAAAVQRPDATAEATALFELLFPHDSKFEVDDTDNLHLLVDEDTAAIPWEIVSGRSGGHPSQALALRTGMLRQLRPVENGTPVRRSGRPPIDNVALVVGDPPLGGNWPRLPGARREALEVAQLLTSRGYTVVQLIFDDDSKPEQAWIQVQTALVQRPYRVVHFATHGDVDPVRPDRTGLLIGDNIRLTAVDFRQMSVTPDLMFLNACHVGSTGQSLGQRRSGARVNELAASLSLQLMRNGVKAVVAAGWAVDDRAAQVFARTLYTGLLDGERYGDAVHRARTESFDNGRTNTWGAYQCYGDPSFALALSSGRTRPRRSLSAEDLIRRLDVLACAAGDVTNHERLAGVRDQVANLDRTEVPRFIGVSVYEALGRAYRELGCFSDAVWAYRESVKCDEGVGSMTIESTRQLANLEARLAVNTELHRPAEFAPEHTLPDEPAVLFTEAERRLQRLTGFQNTSDTFEILGSLHKKRAAATSTKAVRTKELLASEAAYRQAMENSLTIQKEPVLPTYSTCMWIQMSRLARPRAKLNLQASVLQLLERQLQLKAVGRTITAPLSISALVECFESAGDSGASFAKTTAEELELKENTLTTDDSKPRSHRAADDFWIDAGLGDSSITRAVFTRGVHFDSATKPYTTAFKNRSTVRERMSVLDHLRDLVALAPPNSEDVKTLTRLIATLETAAKQ